jgi:hypothetical protein
MITPSHLIYSWALARKTETNEQNNDTTPASKRTLAFVSGALFPDIPTYVFFIVCGLILGYSGEIMWDEMYFNSGWSIPITLTHSFWLWPLLIAISTYFGHTFIRWFSISAFFHALVDFLVHTDDAYRHFWPFSEWKFHSPVSYYRASEYGNWVSAFDSLLVLGLLTYLYTKCAEKWRLLILGVGTLYALRLVAEPIMNTVYGS